MGNCCSTAHGALFDEQQVPPKKTVEISGSERGKSVSNPMAPTNADDDADTHADTSEPDTDDGAISNPIRAASEDMGTHGAPKVANMSRRSLTGLRSFHFLNGTS